MSEASMRWRLAAILAAAGTVVVVIAVLIGASSGDRAGPASGPSSADVPAQGAVRVQVSESPPGRRIPRGFLGLSIEFQAVRVYTGSDPRHVNPVLVQLIRNLFPGQVPVLRIGGDSTDISWVPAPGVRPPNYDSYRLTPSWLATTAALAHTLHARMIMGLNLAADQPALAAAEARAYTRAIGKSQLQALEIGNEPNLYGKIALLQLGPEHFRRARPRSYDYRQFAREFSTFAARVGAFSLAGPALALGPTADPGSWIGSMGGFLRSQPRLRIMTVHRYPLRNCYVGPRSPQYPSVGHLLSDYSTTTLAAGLERWVRLAHAQHRRLRVDELNSVACRGRAGVSDTFASALWVTNALFSLAQAGVDGINMHTLPRSAYELFHFTRSGGHWSAYVQPVYYGLALFAQAVPPGARVLGNGGATGAGGLTVWSTRGPDGTLRTVLVNASPTRTRSVSLNVPAGTTGTATVIRLRAASVRAQRGVTWGGHGYGTANATGQLPPPETQSLTPHAGTYTLSVPHGSAALVTFAG
jgi:Glycosyl hydrolase family 79 C-terminal beta domain